ncbi:UNVERIFIED_CONTAM: hypothetical protein HDU68_011001 [Siphonaria sp. JEL0065]|nr:hypothetical protein HDU68_011001 [Siphonaria sp. JEL0065]
MRKKCTQVIGSAACDRCKRAGVDCTYQLREFSQSIESTPNDQPTEDASVQTLIDVHEVTVPASAGALREIEKQNNKQYPAQSPAVNSTNQPTLSLEDVDLLPTIEDWYLVYSAGTACGSKEPVYLSYDGHDLIDTFFLQPPAWRFQQAVSSDAVTVNINSDRIKPPAAVYDHRQIFEAIPQALYMCEAYALIDALKRLYSQPPKSLHEVLASEPINCLHSVLLQLQGRIPIEYLLISETTDTLLSSDYTRFTSQLSPLSPRGKTYVLSLNMDLFSSVCILNRPRLYLSGLKTYNPIYIDTATRYIIANSVKECLDKAFRIVNLLPLTVGILEIDSYFAVTYPLFEALIVFWFVSCRMNKMWWEVLPRKKAEWPVMYERCVSMVQFVQKVNRIEGSKTGITTPMLKCMEAMLQEMVDVEGGGVDRGNVVDSPQINDDDGDVAQIVLGMEIVSLDEATSLKQISITKEPHCYLGLLGMEVCGRVRWKGSTEESWRLFWKLYS